MSIFEDFSRLCEDFAVCEAAFNVAHNNTKEILSSVKSRLDAERAQTAARIAELEACERDPEKSATVRRMIALELEQLRNRAVPAPTPEETAAFNQEANAAKDAIRDLRALKKQITGSIDAINAEIKRLRSETLGHDTDLRDRWLDEIQKEFNHLVRG